MGESFKYTVLQLNIIKIKLTKLTSSINQALIQDADDITDRDLVINE